MKMFPSFVLYVWFLQMEDDFGVGDEAYESSGSEDSDDGDENDTADDGDENDTADDGDENDTAVDGDENDTAVAAAADDDDGDDDDGDDDDDDDDDSMEDDASDAEEVHSTLFLSYFFQLCKTTPKYNEWFWRVVSVIALYSINSRKCNLYSHCSPGMW